MSQNKERFGLNMHTISAINSVFARHKCVAKVIIYGSRAKGNYKPGSDIDLTIISNTATIKDLLIIADEIDELLLPYKIDLSLFSLIESDEFLEHINQNGIQFYPQ